MIPRAVRSTVAALVRRRCYPDNHGRPIRRDPTYGRIDRDLQWKIHDSRPSSLGQRVAMENNAQQQRDLRRSA